MLEDQMIPTEKRNVLTVHFDLYAWDVPDVQNSLSEK